MGPFDMNYEDVANGAILNKRSPDLLQMRKEFPHPLLFLRRL